MRADSGHTRTQITISDDVAFPAEVLYHLPERDRWAVRILANDQTAAARSNQMIVLSPAGSPPPAYEAESHMGGSGGCACI
jgi:hypothetical protein